MSGNGDGPPPGGTFLGVLLMGACCAVPLLLVGGGAAAIGGFLGDNLWAILGGVAILAVGLFVLKGQNTEGEN